MRDPSNTPGRSAAVKYWDAIGDPQNLERAQGSPITLAAEIKFARTPDFTAGSEWIRGGSTLVGRRVLDLGAGFGANTIALAQDGLDVIAADASFSRIRQLRRRAAGAGVRASKILAVVAAAEALPFADGTLGGIYTKSVLIHTDLENSAAEIRRTLAPGARAALAEPQPGNPFAWLYRRLLAPKAWAAITRYFDPQTQQIFLRGFRIGSILPFYLFSFMAFVFQFAAPRPALFGICLWPLHLLDQLIFRVLPSFRRLAWFGVIRLEKDAEQPPES